MNSINSMNTVCMYMRACMRNTLPTEQNVIDINLHVDLTIQ